MMFYDDLLQGIAQDQVTGVWLLGKMVSAVACLGILLWLIAGISERALLRSREVPVKNSDADQGVLPLDP